MTQLSKEQLIKALELYFKKDLNELCDENYKKENEQTSIYIKDEFAVDYFQDCLNKVLEEENEFKVGDEVWCQDYNGNVVKANYYKEDEGSSLKLVTVNNKIITVYGVFKTRKEAIKTNKRE